jgi:hypothetical protein
MQMPRAWPQTVVNRNHLLKFLATQRIVVLANSAVSKHRSVRLVPTAGSLPPWAGGMIAKFVSLRLARHGARPEHGLSTEHLGATAHSAWITHCVARGNELGLSSARGYGEGRQFIA